MAVDNFGDTVHNNFILTNRLWRLACTWLLNWCYAVFQSLVYIGVDCATINQRF